MEQTFQRRDPKLIILVVNHFSGKRLYVNCNGEMPRDQAKIALKQGKLDGITSDFFLQLRIGIYLPKSNPVARLRHRCRNEHVLSSKMPEKSFFLRGASYEE